MLYTKPSDEKVNPHNNSRLILKHLYYAYKDKPVLEDISFEVLTGTLTVIAGNNGCGKSTLLSVLSGAQKALKIKEYKTEFMLCSADTEIPDMYLIHEKNGSSPVAGYVPQEDPLLPELSVKENLLLRFKGKNSEFKNALELPSVQKMEIEDLLNKKPSVLSGGMKKRVSIACALINDPQVLILDEPSASLDLSFKNHLRTFIKEFTKGNGTVIMSSHDPDDFRSADNLFLLKDKMLSPTDYDTLMKEFSS